MTNKLPVVGKRYIPKKGLPDYDNVFTGLRIASVRKKYVDCVIDHLDVKESLSINELMENYEEELPEDKAETKPACGYCGGTKKVFGLSKPPIEIPCDVCCNVTSTLDKKAETKPTTQNHISELSPEVEEAIMDLKLKLYSWDQLNKLNLIIAVGIETRTGHGNMIAEAAQNLLNALDKQFANND